MGTQLLATQTVVAQALTNESTSTLIVASVALRTPAAQLGMIPRKEFETAAHQERQRARFGHKWGTGAHAGTGHVHAGAVYGGARHAPSDYLGYYKALGLQ
eukprot:243736-Prorocentrum_minimum.AAC.2